MLVAVHPAETRRPSIMVGLLVITADDWGCTRDITDAILECFMEGRVTTVSAMTHMEDSQRAAELARLYRIPVGLHLNFSEAYTGADVADSHWRHQAKLVRYFTSRRWKKWIFNPLISADVTACMKEQLDAFSALYGRAPSHIDGHHHVHLSPNVLLSSAFPSGIPVRRSYTYLPPESGKLNRAWRHMWNRYMTRRFLGTSYLFDMQSLDTSLDRAAMPDKLTVAHGFPVEVMTHPGSPREFDFLTGNRWAEVIARYRLGTHCDIPEVHQC